MPAGAYRRGRGVNFHWPYRAGHDRHFPVGEAPGPVEFVGDEDDRSPILGTAAQELVEEVPAGGVEPGVGFVEEQEPGPAGQSHGQARPALLAGREAPEGHAGQSAEAQLLQDGVGVGHPATTGPDPEAHVLPDAEVVVGARSVADEGHFGADGVPVGSEVVAEDDGRPGRQREETGQEPEQCGLARPVGPGDQHHLTLGDVEVDAGQRRVPPQETDGGA
jgi:hypothetical protein